MSRILVVEDDDRTSVEIEAALGDHGHRVERVTTGREGILRAVAESYDAIILDRMLPGDVDGLGALAALRAAGVLTPVLILSALSAVDERVRGLKAGGPSNYPPFGLRFPGAFPWRNLDRGYPR